MYTDLFLLVAIVLFGISGFFQGIVLQIISLLSLLGIILFSSPLARMLKERSESESIQNAPMFVLWCFSALAIAILAIMIRLLYLKYRKSQEHSPLDRWLGLGLGLAKGLVFALIAGVMIANVPADLRKAFADLDQDFSKSTVIKNSAHLKAWEFIPSISELNQIQKELREERRLGLSREQEIFWQDMADEE